jgi:hypothetical protein
MSNNLEHRQLVIAFKHVAHHLRSNPTPETNKYMITVCTKILMAITGLRANMLPGTAYHYLLVHPMADIAQSFDDLGLGTYYSIEDNKYTFTVECKAIECHYRIQMPYTMRKEQFFPKEVLYH